MSDLILILCSMDTKSELGSYLREKIRGHGGRSAIVDIGIGREPEIVPDITAGEVAIAGGGKIEAIRASRDTATIIETMIKGATAIASDFLENGELGGVIAIGGASNTTTATTIMKALPFGIPKLMVSSSASMPAYAASYIGTKDITMMHSVVELSQLNEITRSVLERAAGGICGQVRASTGVVEPHKGPPLIAVTSFKFSEECSQKVIDLLEDRGYAVIAFHAQGVGEQAMEELIDGGLFEGVIDVVPAGVAEELLGGNRAAGPYRLEAAGRRGIPQIITPCGFDMISCGPLSRKDSDDLLWQKRRLAERKMFLPDEFRLQVRTSADELEDIAKVVAEKLNCAEGPVRVFVPKLGWSSLGCEGGDLYEPETDAVFVPALCRHLKPGIRVDEQETKYNSFEFATALVDAMDEMLNMEASPDAVRA